MWRLMAQGLEAEEFELLGRVWPWGSLGFGFVGRSGGFMVTGWGVEPIVPNGRMWLRDPVTPAWSRTCHAPAQQQTASDGIWRNRTH